MFQGFATRAVREADAQLAAPAARKRDALAQQIWVERRRRPARRARRPGSESRLREGVQSSRERLALAEGRYQAGAGSVIELGDAQGGVVVAEAQQVRSTAWRSRGRSLIFALGRR